MLFAAANVTVSCQQGTHKYLLETVGKGFYEVIGTLQAGGNITEMNTVFMGENFGERTAMRPPPSPRPSQSSHPLFASCAATDTDMYVQMVKLTHALPDIF